MRTPSARRGPPRWPSMSPPPPPSPSAPPPPPPAPFVDDDSSSSCSDERTQANYSAMIDVEGMSPSPSNNSLEKKYFCQRCLNHGLEFPRKGHKPHCNYAQCNCGECRMVEERRQLNNQLSRRKIGGPETPMVNGRRIRDPKCARCSAHGDKNPLRGHKKATCPFNKCTCHLCGLVEKRRSLMAQQIKLRRDQARERESKLFTGKGLEMAMRRPSGDDSDGERHSSSVSMTSSPSASSLPPLFAPRPVQPQPVPLPTQQPPAALTLPTVPAATAFPPFGLPLSPSLVSPSLLQLQLLMMQSMQSMQSLPPLPFPSLPSSPPVPQEMLMAFLQLQANIQPPS